MADIDDNEYFTRYFHERAAVADDLAAHDRSVDANIIATTALDALGEVWLHDFPLERATMEKEVGGVVPPAIRMARLVKRFSVGAPHVGKVAVVLFAVDWKRLVPADAADADALLGRRWHRKHGELPYSHLDVPRDDLVHESPALAAPAFARVIEEYEYPALVYRFLRSPFVHFGTSSKRTHGFARGDEVFYMQLAKGMTIDFRVGLVTGWLRAAATAYVAHCNREGVRPATGIEPAQQAEDALESRWKKVAAR